jgi:uncharacterized protein YkwD
MPARSLTKSTLLLGALVLAMVALPAPAAQARDGAKLNRHERSLLREINRIRVTAGLKRLWRNRRLERSADYHCWDMLRANFFAHASSNGTSFQTRVGHYTHRRRIGENLAYLPSGNARSPRKVVEMWMASPEHRDAILSSSFRRVGIARRIGKWGDFRVAVYTVDFASRR